MLFIQFIATIMTLDRRWQRLDCLYRSILWYNCYTNERWCM